ncbi:hypothetical protein [Cellulomonas marina]|uniref:Sporulation and spore germination n=1 Tax=Cellulomonas marina TaxID=988821 RepID=A0A1I1ANG8_9CELL|nr:hypothetical protein [Cellulomonas marina]GIG30462.1 hypothetical protein Cma02nite_30620 [Cellulomonas marina]SFB38946.1 hypothetical protein SAMN05421867_1204 [Cellulomonas marina]
MRVLRATSSVAALVVLGPLVVGCAGRAGSSPTPLATASGTGPAIAAACTGGAPVRQTVDFGSEPVVEDLSPEGLAAAAAQDLAVGEVQRLGGDRIGAFWLDGDPPKTLVVDLTVGPPVPELEVYAATAPVPVEVRYTAALSREELATAADLARDAVAGDPQVAGSSNDEVNNRVVFFVPAGEDGGRKTCTRLAAALDPLGVPYAFDVFDGPDESTVRGPVRFSPANPFTAAGSTEIHVHPSSCNGEPEVTRLEENHDEVRLEITSTTAAPGWGSDECLDGLAVTLQEPLGDRALVDLSSGETVHAAR